MPFSSNVFVNSGALSFTFAAASGSVTNFSAAGEWSPCEGSSACQTSEHGPSPRSSVSVQPSSLWPARSRGIRGGRREANSSGL
jgi:hypothetical protein